MGAVGSTAISGARGGARLSNVSSSPPTGLACRCTVASSSSDSSSVLSMKDARSVASSSLSGLAGRVNEAPGTRVSAGGLGRVSTNGLARVRGVVAARPRGVIPIIVAACPETGGRGGTRNGGGAATSSGGGGETTVCSESAGGIGIGTGARRRASSRRCMAALSSSISRSSTRSSVGRGPPPAGVDGPGRAPVTRQRPRIATDWSRRRMANRPSVPIGSSPDAGSTSAPSDARPANLSTNSSREPQRVLTWISGPRAAPGALREPPGPPPDPPLGIERTAPRSSADARLG